jgi:hypothetical protein
MVLRLHLERVTLKFVPINGVECAGERHLNFELFDDEMFLDSVVIDKDDLLWLLGEDD